MRAVDFWLGVPLCFLLTLVARLQRVLGLGAEPAAGPKKILFIQLAEMGTMVVAYPALRKARELFPGAALHVLCFEQIRSSVEILNLIPREQVHTIDAGGAWSFVRDTLLWPWRARRLGIDTVVNLEAFVRYSSLLSFLSGARRRVGFHRFNQEGLYTGDLVTHKVLFNSHIHTAHIFLDLVHALVAPPTRASARETAEGDGPAGRAEDHTDAATAERIWAKLRALPQGHRSFAQGGDPQPERERAIPDAARPARRLRGSGETTAGRPGRLRAHHRCTQRKAGGATDVHAGRIAARAGSDRERRRSRNLLHVFDLSHVLVSNDSGPAHFAAPDARARHRVLWPRDSRALSPARHELRRRPHRLFLQPLYRPHNQRLSPCNNNLCLQTIDIPAVTDLVRMRLAQATVDRLVADARH